MPRRAIDLWVPFLDEIIAFTDELDPDFKIGTLDRAGVVAMRDQVKALLRTRPRTTPRFRREFDYDSDTLLQIGRGVIVGRVLSALDSLQAQTGLQMGKRDEEIDEIEDLAVKLRGAVVARYGPKSVQAKRCPKLKRRSASSAAKPKDPSR